jgi:hypothetical protein
VLDLIIPPWLNYSTHYLFKCFLFETYHIKAPDLIYLASFINPGFQQQNSRYRQVKDPKLIIGWIVSAHKISQWNSSRTAFSGTTIRVEEFSQDGMIKSGTLFENLITIKFWWQSVASVRKLRLVFIGLIFEVFDLLKDTWIDLDLECQD